MNNLLMIITPLIVPMSNGGGSLPEGWTVFNIILLIVILSASLLYILYFFLFEWYREAETKKQFILQWLIPFYWWVVWTKEWVKAMIERYKELK